MIALKAKYHPRCTTALFNGARQHSIVKVFEKRKKKSNSLSVILDSRKRQQSTVLAAENVFFYVSSSKKDGNVMSLEHTAGQYVKEC